MEIDVERSKEVREEGRKGVGNSGALTFGLRARLTDSKVEGNSQSLEPNLCLDSRDPEMRASRKRAGTPG